MNIFLRVFTLVFLSQIVWANTDYSVTDFKIIPVNNEMIRQSLRTSALDFRKNLEIIPGTKSEELNWLLTANTQRDVFLNRTQQEVQNQFSKNVEFEKIKTFLFDNLSKKNDEEFLVRISESRKIVVSNDQYVRTVYDVDGEQKKIIFSTNDYLPKKAAVVDLNPSPQKDYIASIVSLDGSTDNGQLIVYSIQDKKIILNIEIASIQDGALWFSNSQVMYTHPLSGSHGTTLIIQDLKTQQKQQFINFGFVSYSDWVGYTDLATDYLFLKNLKSGQQLNYKNLPITDIILEDEESFYLKSNSSLDYNGQILKLAKENLASISVFIEKMNGYYLESFKKMKNGQFYAVYSRDSQNTLVVYSASGNKVHQMVLPDSLSVSGLEVAEGDNIYTLSVKSVFSSDNVTWKAKEASPDFSEILKQGSKKNNLEVVTRIEYFKSKDGEDIPARITHKKDLLITGNQPVFMETYGGFNIEGYLAPVFNKMKLEFIQRGGIYVGAGVRGGSERGYEWYKAGSGQNEMNTTFDVIAIAEGLVKNGYTISKQIVLAGGSNGGYVVANAALTSPQSFGLVIPINGVHDQLDFPSLDRWGITWQSEYLNPYDAKDFRSVYVRAPLEINPTVSDKPFFFIVNGESDSRVNKVHSYKLKAKLDEIWPGQSILFSVNHAGHGATSSYLLDDIGAEASAHVWSEIFTHTGLQF